MRGRAGGDELDVVERFARRRWLVVVLFTITFACLGLRWIIQLGGAPSARGVGSPAGVSAVGGGIAWALWGVAVLVVTFGHGGPRWSARQQRVLNDELVAADRRMAAMIGYWTLLAGVAALCIAEVMGAATPGVLLGVGVPVLVTIGIAAPAVAFSALQLRADGDAAEHG